MIRAVNMVLAVTSMVALVGVYAQKYRAEETAAEMRAISAAIARQQEDLSILKADWAFLNQPTQIQPIVERHNEELQLERVAAAQFGSFDDFSMRPSRPDTAALDALFEALDQGIDPIGQLLEELGQ